MKLRIDKYLADMGTGSRSDVKAFIRKGMVKINGTTARTGKEKVDTDCDIVLMNMNIILSISRQVLYQLQRTEILRQL